MLELQSLQSTSDQTDYISNSYIAVNIATALAPEQAGMWVYPYQNDDEHNLQYDKLNASETVHQWASIGYERKQP